MICLVLIGPPGAGKSTQAVLLAREFGLAHISAGDILRAEVAAGTDLGKIADPAMAAGEMIPDFMMIEAIAKRIARPDCDGGILFDGFPRTARQARELDILLSGMGRPVNAVIELQADEATLTGRMNARAAAAIARGELPRKDDTIDTFQNRLGIYQAQSNLTVPYYATQDFLDTIDAARPVDTVAADVLCAMLKRGYKPVRLCSSPPAPPGAAPTPI